MRQVLSRIPKNISQSMSGLFLSLRVQTSGTGSHEEQFLWLRMYLMILWKILWILLLCKKNRYIVIYDALL